MKILTFKAFLFALLTGTASHSLLVFIKLANGEVIEKSDLLFALISISIMILILLYMLIRHFGWSLIKKIYKVEINHENKISIEKELEKFKNNNNILKVYPNMNASMKDICLKLSTEKNISIFVQIGTEILSGKGLFYECLKENIAPNKIRILHSSVRTIYLSGKEAQLRSRGKLDEWKLNLQSAELLAIQLAKYFNTDSQSIFEDRVHHEGYYWRFFLFDDECFIQPYIYKSKNASQAPVFRLKNTKDSMYKTFQEYFENKWVEYEANKYYLHDFIKEAFPLSVTAILRFKSLYIFSIPKRYVKKNAIFVQAVGGKVDKEETFKSALIREVKEEINTNITVLSSKQTYHYNGGVKQSKEYFHDDPAPYSIYRRDTSTGNRNQNVKWILLYEAIMNIDSLGELEPRNETALILCLSRVMLERLVNGKVVLNVHDIQTSKDGSCFLGDTEDIKPSVTLYPKGMTAIINESIGNIYYK